jgi:hypothetical protein
MFPWTFWVIVVIVALFVAVLVAKAISAPIKQKRADRRWQQKKQEWANGHV